MTVQPRTGTHAAPRQTQGETWRRGATFLTASTLLISVANYAFSLSMTSLLPADEFVDFVAIQSLLLVIGTGVMAAVPWVLARDVARIRQAGEAGAGSSLGQSLHFGLSASAAQGVVAGVVAGIVGFAVAGPWLGLVAAVTGLALSFVAAPIGFLQGEERFGAIAMLRIAEALVRVGLGLLVVLAVSRTAAGALVTMSAASLLLTVGGLALCRRGLPLVRTGRRHLSSLVRQSAFFAAAQIGLTALAAMDTVIIGASGIAAEDAAVYQFVALLGRVPLFVGVALSQAAYPSMSTAGSESGERRLRMPLYVYGLVSLLFLAGAWSMPAPVLALLGAGQPERAGDLLRMTSLLGVAVGMLSVISVGYLAHLQYRKLLLVVLPAVILQPVVLLLAARSSVEAYASSAAVFTVVVAACLAFDSRRWWFSAIAPTPMTMGVVCVVGGAAAVALAVGSVIVWVVLMTLVTGLVAQQIATSGSDKEAA